MRRNAYVCLCVCDSLCLCVCVCIHITQLYLTDSYVSPGVDLEPDRSNMQAAAGHAIWTWPGAGVLLCGVVAETAVVWGAGQYYGMMGA